MTGGGVHYSFEAIGLKIAAEQGFPNVTSWRNSHRHRNDSSWRYGDNSRSRLPIGEKDPRINDGVKLISRRHAKICRFLSARSLAFDDLVSNRIQLADINEGMAALETGEVARSVIMFND